MPLIVHSIWRAPASIAARLFATAKPKIVVAMNADRHVFIADNTPLDLPDQIRKLVRKRIADRVRDIQDSRPFIDCGREHFAKKIDIACVASSAENSTSSARLLARRMDLFGHLRNFIDGFFSTCIEVDVRCRDERVYPR